MIVLPLVLLGGILDFFGFLFAQKHLWFALLLLLLIFFFAFLHFFICVPEAEVCDAFMVIVEK